MVTTDQEWKVKLLVDAKALPVHASSQNVDGEGFFRLLIQNRLLPVGLLTARYDASHNASVSELSLSDCSIWVSAADDPCNYFASKCESTQYLVGGHNVLADEFMSTAIYRRCRVP